MIAKLRFQKIRTTLFLLLVWSAVSCGFSGHIHAQSRSTKSPPAEKPKAHPSPRVYEDDEIKLRIPEGWAIINTSAANANAREGGFLGNGVIDAKRNLLLAKDGYTLALAYDTEHASGVNGGRFEEVFAIPWLSEDVLGLCSLHLASYPLPAGRTLLFTNLYADTGVPEVREACSIPQDLVYKTDKKFVGERRWIAGYFTTAYSGWFFASAGEGCGLKAYVLTAPAKTPNQLPDPDDPTLKTIIQQAIDLVGAVHYKRCPPTAGR